jgi:hypothetical protein
MAWTVRLAKCCGDARNMRVDQTDIAPVVSTDLLLLSYEKSGRTFMEAVDIMTGNPLWKNEKVKGSIMQLAVDPEYELVALVVVRDAEGRLREGVKRRPTIHLLSLADGNELWKRELESEVEMMPSRWGAKEDEDTLYTLDNYRPPLFLEGRVYFFYDGVTSLDARTGRERIREQFRVNEEGLALTEADPVWNDQYLIPPGEGECGQSCARPDGLFGRQKIWGLHLNWSWQQVYYTCGPGDNSHD